MAYYLRAHSGRGMGGVKIDAGEIGRMRWLDRAFVTAAPLVMHDACASEHGVGGHPWDVGRKAFSDVAGQPLCWSAGEYGGATPCYWCGEEA